MDELTVFDTLISDTILNNKDFFDFFLLFLTSVNRPTNDVCCSTVKACS